MLVGNFGDGHINAFDAKTGPFLGQLTDAAGAPLTNVGIWGMTFGNGAGGTQRNTLLTSRTMMPEGHLETCAGCAAALRQMQGLRGAVQEAAPYHRASAALTRVGVPPSGGLSQPEGRTPT